MFQSARPVRGATLTPIGRWPPVGFALTMAAMSDIASIATRCCKLARFRLVRFNASAGVITLHTRTPALLFTGYCAFTNRFLRRSA